MSEISKISWTSASFNPWIGCKKVSEACDNCYANRENERFKWVDDFYKVVKRTSINYWLKPITWNKTCEKLGIRKKVFCASLGDVFDDRVPNSWRNDLWYLIENTDNLDWQILTKRPQNFQQMLKVDWLDNGLPPNVWLGITAENQVRYNERSKYFKDIKCKVKFISVEPILGTVIVNPELTNWVIIGGESGIGARISRWEWIRDTMANCKSLGIPVFFKQWGEWIPDTQFPENSAKKMYDKGIPFKRIDDQITYFRIGKKESGDKIHGKEYHNFPRKYFECYSTVR